MFIRHYLLKHTQKTGCTRKKGNPINLHINGPINWLNRKRKVKIKKQSKY